MTRNKVTRLPWFLALTLAVSGASKMELSTVIARVSSQKIDLPGEFLPFQKVEVHAKVRGYVSEVLVDRGSAVRKGQLLAVLTAPEMKSQISEAESKVRTAEAEKLQADAQFTAAQSTYKQMQKAAETPGAIAGNELIQAQAQVKAADAVRQAKAQTIQAFQDLLRGQTELASYLRITAPFSGIVTARFVHPGALVGPGADPVLLVVEEVARLRLVVAVPEQNVGAIEPGARVDVRVPAFPQRTYAGTVARIAHSLDERTRTMAVELDVWNRDNSLAPGMYPSVRWPVQGKTPSLFVQKTSVVTTTERTFVIRVRSGQAEWVNVAKGTADGDQIEVFGELHEGDKVVLRASDEIRPGMAIQGVKK